MFSRQPETRSQALTENVGCGYVYLRSQDPRNGDGVGMGGVHWEGRLEVFPELLRANQRALGSMGDLVSKSKVGTIEEDTRVDLGFYTSIHAHVHTYVQDVKTI